MQALLPGTVRDYERVRGQLTAIGGVITYTVGKSLASTLISRTWPCAGADTSGGARP